jgi:hypothetical protein
VPANADAIVAKAIPGGELTCRAHNFTVDGRGGRVERGVLSYYATEWLERADTIGAWLTAIEAAMEAARSGGRLRPFETPLLQVLGDPAAKVAGRAVATR